MVKMSTESGHCAEIVPAHSDGCCPSSVLCFVQQFPDNGFSPWPSISLTPGKACLFLFGQKYKFGALEQTQYLKYEEGRLERGATARAVELWDYTGRRD